MHRRQPMYLQFYSAAARLNLLSQLARNQTLSYQNPARYHPVALPLFACRNRYQMLERLRFNTYRAHVGFFGVDSRATRQNNTLWIKFADLLFSYIRA